MQLAENVVQALVWKFTGLKRRCLAAVNQLSDEDVIWSPNENSNSVANLALHIRENARQRAGTVFREIEHTRDRDAEFASDLVLSKAEVITALEQSFDLVIEIVGDFSEEDLLSQPFPPNPPANSGPSEDSTVLEVFLQMLSHYSQHVGQILYIAKARLDDTYVSTSIPKAKPNS